jgi:hypothetical protein
MCPSCWHLFPHFTHSRQLKHNMTNSLRLGIYYAEGIRKKERQSSIWLRHEVDAYAWLFQERLLITRPAIKNDRCVWFWLRMAHGFHGRNDFSSRSSLYIPTALLLSDYPACQWPSLDA